jgi:hypothetical protein
LISCKEFLNELNEYLDEMTDPTLKQHWQDHVDQCDNCHVMVDTTRKTLQVYKGMEQREVPDDVKNRLWVALERKMASRKAAQS